MGKSKQVIMCCIKFIKRFFCRVFKLTKLKLVVLCGIFFSGLAQAGAFSTLLEMAHNNEPTYLGAKATVKAAEARTDQAFGQLLPQVSANLNTKYNDRNYQQRDDTDRPAKDQYNSHSTEVTLTQSIWKYPNIIGLRQAKSATFQAEQQLANTEQELLAKVVSGWLDFLGARDQTLFTQQQIMGSDYRLQVAQRGFDIGLISKPELDDVRAKLEQAISEDITADADLNLKRASLEQIAGDVSKLKPVFMRGDAELFDLKTESLEKVLNKVELGNHNILAALHAYEAANAEVKKQFAGHQPTLDLVASYGKNSQAVGGFPGQPGYDITQGTIGLQLNIPIYAGGVQSAKVQEAVAQAEKARFDIEVAKRASILSAKQAWYGWFSAHAKAIAATQAIVSAKSALLSAEVAVNSGLKTEVVVFEAQQQLSAAERDYSRSRYDQMAYHIKLKSMMGLLNNEDIVALDALFIDDHWTLRLEKNESQARLSN